MANILRIAGLIGELMSNCNTIKSKDYLIRCAVRDGVISDTDGEILRKEYCTGWCSHMPEEYRYTVSYLGALWDGEEPGTYNARGFDRWEDAHEYFQQNREYVDNMIIDHNECGVTFDGEEWY